MKYVVDFTQFFSNGLDKRQVVPVKAKNEQKVEEFLRKRVSNTEVDEYVIHSITADKSVK
jgi:hypothetical protein